MRFQRWNWTLGLLLAFTMVGSLVATPPPDSRLDAGQYFWGGVGIGRFSGGELHDVVGGGLHLSAQFSSRNYFSVYGLGASRWFSDGNTISEIGILAGFCRRRRATFIGAAAGIAAVSFNAGSASANRAIGLPVRLEFSVILGKFVAAGIKIHAVLTDGSYLGVLFGIELGKMR